MEQSPSAAPVTARAEIDVAADERIVWATLADVASWPTWDPSVRHVTFDADLERGTTFRYASVLGSISCRLTRVEAPRELAWDGRLLTMTLRQAFHVEPAESGSRVSVDASLSGVLARLFRGRLQARLQAELDSVAQLLKLEAEVRSVEQADEAARTASEGEARDG